MSRPVSGREPDPLGDAAAALREALRRYPEGSAAAVAETRRLLAERARDRR